MKASRIITFILGIFMISTGVYCLLSPALTYMTLGYIIGINMIIDAIGGFILWHERKKAGDADGWAFAGSVVSLVFGVLLTCSTAFQWIVDIAFVYFAAIWLIVIGILRFILAIRVRRMKKSLDIGILGGRWWLVMIFGILTVACGVFSLFNPSVLIIAIGLNLGLNVIVAGSCLIAVAV